MPIDGPRHRFNSWQISGAMAEAGVYALWSGDELIYIGRAFGRQSAGAEAGEGAEGEAMTIRSRLFEHYTKRAAPYDATHFSYEITAHPAMREAELLAEYEQAHACRPRWNV